MFMVYAFNLLLDVYRTDCVCAFLYVQSGWGVTSIHTGDKFAGNYAFYFQKLVIIILF